MMKMPRGRDILDSYPYAFKAPAHRYSFIEACWLLFLFFVPTLLAPALLLKPPLDHVLNVRWSSVEDLLEVLYFIPVILNTFHSYELEVV
jgi:hypothetical protein